MTSTPPLPTLNHSVSQQNLNSILTEQYKPESSRQADLPGSDALRPAPESEGTGNVTLDVGATNPLNALYVAESERHRGRTPVLQPTCHCQPESIAVLREVEHEPDSGQQIWTCAKPEGERCSFEWEDNRLNRGTVSDLNATNTYLSGTPPGSLTEIGEDGVPERAPSPLVIWVDLQDMESLPGGVIPEVNPNPPGGISVALEDTPRPKRSWSGLVAKAKKGIADLTERVRHD